MEKEIVIADPDTIIKPDETALVVEGNGNLRLVVPKSEMDTHPPMAALLAAICVRARDPVWVEEMFEWYTAGSIKRR